MNEPKWMNMAIEMIDQAAKYGGTIVVPNKQRKELVERAILRRHGPEVNIPVTVDQGGDMRLIRE